VNALLLAALLTADAGVEEPERLPAACVDGPDDRDAVGTFDRQVAP